MTFKTCQKRPPKSPLWSDRDGSGSKKAQKTHLVPKNMVRILKSNVQYHKVFSKIFLQFFFIPRRKNAWISIFFTKFSGNIEIFSASPRILSILPSNLVKKILIQAFFLTGNKKIVGKFFRTLSDNGNNYYRAMRQLPKRMGYRSIL